MANSWRRERWDSLRLLTPNWQSRLPGHRYDGPDPGRLHDDARGDRVHLALRQRVARAGSHRYERHVGHAHRRRVSRRDDATARSAAGASCSRAARATCRVSRRCTRRCRRPSNRSPRSTIATPPSCPRGCARRRRFGDGRAARGRNSRLGAAGDTLGRRARPAAAHVPRTRRAVVDGSVGRVGSTLRRHRRSDPRATPTLAAARRHAGPGDARSECPDRDRGSSWWAGSPRCATAWRSSPAGSGTCSRSRI